MASSVATDNRDGKDRIPFLNCHFDNVSFDEVVDRVACCIENDSKGYMCSLNVDIAVKLDSDEEFRRAYDSADLALMDSTPLMKIAKKRGIAVKEKLSGSDLMPALCAVAEEKGWSCCIMGGAPGVPEAAAQSLLQRFPRLVIGGAFSPPYGFEKDEAALQGVISEINRSQANLLFVCLGAPKSEKLMAQCLDRCDVNYAFCVGAAVDFEAGNMPRAPKWMQKAGFEWLFRFAHEPKRLFKRYFVDSWHIVSLLLRNKKG